MKLRLTRSDEAYWHQFGTYALASTIGAVFVLFIGAMFGGMLYDPISWYLDVLSGINRRSGLAWVNDPLESTFRYMIAAACVYLGMAAGIFAVWHWRRVQERSRRFGLRDWRPRLLPELTGVVPKIDVNQPVPSEDSRPQ